MLKELHTVLPAADLQRARTFYHDKLGMDPQDEVDGVLVYRPDSGAQFELYETANAGTAQNTQMGWMTDDLDSEMATMREHGIVFEEYDVPGMKTVNGVATGDAMRSAWFRDSEGNFICISEMKR
ncbi:VOC family protein [Lacisediminihabitans profunda]|uniref:VOC family protein n=1 Tax=Lacisediminihabitans profunda TaxID=2594790 RepID=A0A5C8UNS2_9MICO|nr:VOC family protein [Lacisediminihabitans profunda]TXN28957.1 VOC family protein [Lacisediminihabitans profunda]